MCDRVILTLIVLTIVLGPVLLWLAYELGAVQHRVSEEQEDGGSR